MSPFSTSRGAHMKKSFLTLFTVSAFTIIFCVFTSLLPVEAAKPEVKGAKTSCKACHSNLSETVPKDHPPVKGSTIKACLGCHKPDTSGRPEKNAFSSRIHSAHTGDGSKVDCMMCHTWTPGKRFGLLGQKVSFGAPSKNELEGMKKILASWKKSGYTDSLHGKANVSCAGCHGSPAAKEGDTVENDRCLKCHGPIDKLAAKSAPKDFPDRNPHKSHLGDINCTVCHKGHAESKTYCLDCHKNFKMKKIPGGTEAKK